MVRRRNRLSRSRDFERVYRTGRSVASRFLVLYYFPRSEAKEGAEGPGGTSVRVGFSVSKRLGTAVERNRIKRSLREAFRLAEHSIRPGFDIVFIARADIARVVEEDGVAGVQGKMMEVLRKGGLLSTVEGRAS